MLVIEPYADVNIGANLSNGKVWQKSNRNRRITRMALVGGAASCDAAVDVFYGTEQIANLKNYHTGTPDKTKLLWNTTSLFIGRNVPLNIEVTDAFSSTPTFLILDIKNVR